MPTVHLSMLVGMSLQSYVSSVLLVLVFSCSASEWSKAEVPLDGLYAVVAVTCSLGLLQRECRSRVSLQCQQIA